MVFIILHGAVIGFPLGGDIVSRFFFAFPSETRTGRPFSNTQSGSLA